MQAPIAPRLPLPTAAHEATPLLRPAYAVPPGGLPVFPPTWHAVASARALVLCHEDGRTLSVTTDASTVDIPRVALMGLGHHRLSVYAGSGRCEAHWTAAGTLYRLAAAMPLAGFMDVLISLLWN